MAKSHKIIKKKPWRKILYENQPYPDNYTDKNMFLRDLRKNIDFKEVSFFKAVRGANLLLQEFCTVVSFVIIFYYLVNKLIEPTTILNVTCGITCVLFIFHLTVFETSISEKIGNILRTVLTFVVFGQLFAPVLHTLTDTVSTDTIYNVTFFMMLIHLIFFDYGVSAAVVSNSLSLSAAVFASICLASRLSSAYETFILMTIATELFVLFPMIRSKVGNSFLVTFVLLGVNLLSLFGISWTVFILFAIAVVLINIVCPFLFVFYQKDKENIYGPWDEAIVDDIDNLVL